MPSRHFLTDVEAGCACTGRRLRGTWQKFLCPETGQKWKLFLRKIFGGFILETWFSTIYWVYKSFIWLRASRILLNLWSTMGTWPQGLVYECDRLCHTVNVGSCGSAALSGAVALLHYARTMSHKLLFSVCIHQGEFRRIYLSFLGLGNTLPCYFRQYQCIMPTCFLSITQDSTNIDWVITTLQARLKAVKTVCPKSLQSCPTLYSPMDRSPALSSVLGALKSRIMERVVISASRDLPDPGIEPASHVSCIGSRFFTNSATWEAQNHSTR